VEFNCPSGHFIQSFLKPKGRSRHEMC
jgi:hypothetical protein